MNCNNENNNRFIVNNINPSNFLYNAMYGHAYVRNQILNRLYIPEEGLRNGTMFPELVQNYEPCDSMEEIFYLRGGRR